MADKVLRDSSLTDCTVWQTLPVSGVSAWQRRESSMLDQVQVWATTLHSPALLSLPEK